MARERVEIHPAVGGRQDGRRIGEGGLLARIHIHAGRGERRAHGIQAAQQEARNTLRCRDARVEEEPGVHLVAPRVLRTGERLVERRGLRGRQAAVGRRRATHERFRIEVAGLPVEDEAVLDAVQGIARVEQPVDDGLLLRVGERGTRDGRSRCVLRRDAVEDRGDPFVTDAGEVRPHRRRAGHDAVEVGRIPLRHQHGFAAARRTAREVGVVGRPGVVGRDDPFGQHGDAPHRLIGEVEAGLLFPHEAGVEDLPGVTGVGRHHGESTREGRPVAGGDRAEGRTHGAVQAAPALEEEAPVPVGRQRQRESDAVGLAVRTGSAIEHPVDPAVGRQRSRRGRLPRAGRGRRGTGREPLGLRDREIEAGKLKVRQRGAGCSIRRRLNDARRCRPDDCRQEQDPQGDAHGRILRPRPDHGVKEPRPGARRLQAVGAGYCLFQTNGVPWWPEPSRPPVILRPVESIWPWK